MTLVNTETGEMVEPLTESDAERLTKRIELRLDTIADNYTAVVPMIREAIARNAWSALGYRSPGEYAATRFGDALSHLGPEFRQAVVRELSDLGMSVRAISSVVGVGVGTVSRDQHAPVPHGTPQSSGTANAVPESKDAPDEGAPLQAVPDDSTASPEGEAVVVASTAPRPPVTGLDGKTYARPEPKPKPVMNDDEAEYANATTSSLALSRAISKLLTFQYSNMRDSVRRFWDMASIEVPPTPRRDVTPEQMRVAAQGLLTLADEWETP